MKLIKNLDQQIEHLQWVVMDQTQRVARGPTWWQGRNETDLSYQARYLDWLETAQSFLNCARIQLEQLQCTKKDFLNLQ